MSFFAAAEGIAAPDLQGAGAAGRGGQEPGIEEAEEDWWKCLVRFDPDTVGLGSHRCAFCVVDARPSQGYSVLHAWRSEAGMELLEIHCCSKTGECWTLEKASGEKGELMLVRYKPGPAGAGRVAVAVSATEATFSVSQNGTVTLSLPGGIIEFWRCVSSEAAELHRVASLALGSVLGINTHELLFNHLVLIGPLLVVGISTDVWLVQLRGLAPALVSTDAEGTDEEEEEEEEQDEAAGEAIDDSQQPLHHYDGPLGRLENREDMLDCAVPEHEECILAHPANRPSSRPAQANECHNLSSTAMVVARLSFHRPRYFLSEVKVLAVGSTWVELLLVSGQAACLYRVTNLRAGTQEDVFASSSSNNNSSSSSKSEAAVILRLADLAFNTKVLATASGTSPETPWLFILTLSGVEVWCLPPPGHRPGELSPCRLLVQRLEYRQRLDRLPPIGMLVTRNALVLLANPPGHTPASLPEMLFHTVPRPSLARIPELSSGLGHCAGGSLQPDGAFGIGYGLMALQALPLAAVYQQLRKEVKRALPLGDAAQDEGAEGDQEDFLATRFVEGELLDSSVYGIQPARVIHQSGTELLTVLFALLQSAATASQDKEGSGTVPDWKKEEEGDEEEEEAVLDAARRVHARRLYRHLAQDCASLLGMLWLEPRAEGVSADVPRACDWFAKSSTPVLEVCTKLLALWDRKTYGRSKEEDEEGEEQTRPASSMSKALGAEFVRFIQQRCSRVENEPEEDDNEEGEKGTGAEKGEEEEEEEARQVSWSEVLTLACDLGGEEFLDWVVLHSWLPRLDSCRELLKRLAANTRGKRKEELLAELETWT